jgi:L-lysine 6-oxidase
MMDFCMPSFDLKDESEENRKNRERFFSFFRKSGEKYWGMGGQSNQLFHNDNYLTGIPLMPLNAGSNAVDNQDLDKFVELSRAQHYFLEQWAKGYFTVGEAADDILGIHPLDHADVGNCVGNPMCPGVEVTWNVKNPAIYEAPYRIKHRKKDLQYYFDNGLDPDYDETTPTGRQEKDQVYDLNAPIGKQSQGCEPGDLTKRMADPWVSDLFECNVNHINFTDKIRASDSHNLEAAPTYMAYWWPPQSPWDVILGVTGPADDPLKIDTKSLPNIESEVIKEIKAAGASAGQQVNYLRGIHNHIELVYAWSYLGFIVNQNEDQDRCQYPYFVEKERNHDQFEVSAVAISNKINVVDPFLTRSIAAYHLKEDIIEFSEREKNPNKS